MSVATAPQALVIEGGNPLSGRIRASGNKNGALPILAACLLADEPVTLSNVPRIRDVETMIELVAATGASAEWTGPNEVRSTRRASRRHEVDAVLAERIRASFLLAGPLLARLGRASVPPPGGDVIGRRRLDPHIHALAAARRDDRDREPLRDADGRAARRRHLPRRGERDGDRERGHGGRARARRDDDRERRLRAARAGSLPLPRLARRRRSRASSRTSSGSTASRS